MTASTISVLDHGAWREESDEVLHVGAPEHETHEQMARRLGLHYHVIGGEWSHALCVFRREPGSAFPWSHVVYDTDGVCCGQFAFAAGTDADALVILERLADLMLRFDALRNLGEASEAAVERIGARREA